MSEAWVIQVPYLSKGIFFGNIFRSRNDQVLTGLAMNGIMKETSTKGTDFVDFFVVDEDSEWGCRTSRNLYAINGFLGDINFGSSRNAVGVSEEGSIADLIKVRGFTNLVQEDFNKTRISEVGGNPKEFDSSVKVLKGIAGNVSGRLIPLKQESVTATHNPRLTFKDGKHFFVGLESSKEKVGLDLRDGTIVLTPGPFHIGSHALDRNDSRSRNTLGYLNKQGKFIFRLIFILPAIII